jgi:hypothetical protein
MFTGIHPEDIEVPAGKLFATPDDAKLTASRVK